MHHSMKCVNFKNYVEEVSYIYLFEKFFFLFYYYQGSNFTYWIKTFYIFYSILCTYASKVSYTSFIAVYTCSHFGKREFV